MGLLERLGEIGKSLLTTEAELRHLRDTLADIRQEVRGLADEMQDLRERIVGLGTARAADRAQVETGLVRFKVEVERAVLRLRPGAPPGAEPPALTDQSTE